MALRARFLPPIVYFTLFPSQYFDTAARSITVEDGKLRVEPHEAERVRQIFELYVQTKSMITTLKECNARGWETKRWTTKTGVVRGGKQFTKGYLYQLLNNVVYVGKVRYKKEIHEGEHQGIIDPNLFKKVKQTLSRRDRKGNLPSRRNHSALLRGLLHKIRITFHPTSIAALGEEMAVPQEAIS